MESKRPRNALLRAAPPARAGAEVELYRALLGAGDLDRLFERVFTALIPHLSIEWGGLIAREGSGGRVVSAWELGPGAAPRLESIPLEPERTLLDLPATVREAALPVEWGQPLTGDLHGRGLRRVLFVPLENGTHSGQALLVGWRRAGAFPARGRTLLESIAASLGGAVHTAGRERELERRVEERTRELAVLYDVSRALGTTLRHQDLARIVMAPLHALLEFDIGAILLDMPGLCDLGIHLVRPASPECRAEIATLARSAFREFAGRPGAEPQCAIRTLEEFDPEAAMLSGQLASHQSAPLVRRGEVVGALVVASRREGAFSESRTRLLRTLASQASLTLDRLRTLQEAEQDRVQSIIDSMPQGVLMTDGDLRVEFANPAGRHTLQLLTGQSSPAFLRELGGVSLEAIARPVLHGGEASATAEIRHPDPYRIYSLSVSPVGGPAGRRPTGIVILISDETEARMMQEQLQQSEKLSALGEMISGVAHELNNPLASVMGFAQLLQSARVREDVRRKLQIIYSESQRCQRVVQNLLSFARKHRPEKRLVDLNGALGSVLSLLSYQLRVDGIEVRAALDAGVPAVLGDFHLLQQVFLNIINNAHQAMRECGGSGVLEVSTRVEAPAGESGGEMVRVEIRDTGPGISPENLKRIFDPFFTTKQVGQGTGLGLSLAYGAVREHKGRIYARSALGKGTTFVVELPRATEPGMTIPSASLPESGVPSLARSILVVDDEALLARLLVEALSSRGHRVDAVMGGAEALERIRRRDYDIIISDLKMPHVDGRQLFEQVRLLKPDLSRRMIFSTGDVASAESQEFFDTAGVPVIAKPFDLREVHRTIGKLLGEPGV